METVKEFIPIYIPSMSRANAFHNGTLAWIPEDVKVYMVVPEEQVNDYLTKIHFNKKRRISVISCPEKGIAKTRKFIGEHAAKRGFAKFIMMDDDLKFAKRINNTKLNPCNKTEMYELLDLVQDKLYRYAAVGVSPRQGNNRCEEDFMVNTRLIRFLAFRTQEFLECEHDRVLVMEDFDILLQLLRKGHENFSIFDFCQDQNETQAKGGCSDYRTLENHEASAIKLAELHDPFVKLRQKVNKTGGEFGNRKEVTIYWKKAYLSSKQ